MYHSDFDIFAGLNLDDLVGGAGGANDGDGDGDAPAASLDMVVRRIADLDFKCDELGTKVGEIANKVDTLSRLVAKAILENRKNASRILQAFGDDTADA